MKPVKLNPKAVMALLVEQGIESINAYFLSVTEQMRQDVTKQIQDLRERNRRHEAMLRAIADVQGIDVPTLVKIAHTKLGTPVDSGVWEPSDLEPPARGEGDEYKA